jgi:hypothetical protein
VLLTDGSDGGMCARRRSRRRLDDAGLGAVARCRFVIDFSTGHAAHVFVDDHPFIVLTETKFSLCCIPVWVRYSPLRTRVEKKTYAITLSP